MSLTYYSGWTKVKTYTTTAREPSIYDSLLLEFVIAHKPAQPPQPDNLNWICPSKCKKRVDLKVQVESDTTQSVVTFKKIKMYEN